MKIKITSDSTCDLNKNYLMRKSVDIAPLYIVKDGKSYKDSIEITQNDIFEHIDNGGEMVSTSAINVQEYIDFFNRFKNDYDAIIHINIGSHFSCCYQNANIASKEFNNVYTVNSMNLSSGQGHLVMKAVDMAEEGYTAEEIVKKLEEIIPKVETSFIIDRLDYLQKGGRCSSILSLSAKILKIKPTIEVVNGELVVGKKYTGAFDKVLKRYVKDRLENRDDIDYSRIFVTHPSCKESTVNMVKNELNKYSEFEEVIETRAGCTVSTHCGPFTLGILFIKK